MQISTPPNQDLATDNTNTKSKQRYPNAITIGGKLGSPRRENLTYQPIKTKEFNFQQRNNSTEK